MSNYPANTILVACCRQRARARTNVDQNYQQYTGRLHSSQWFHITLPGALTSAAASQLCWEHRGINTPHSHLSTIPLVDIVVCVSSFITLQVQKIQASPMNCHWHLTACPLSRLASRYRSTLHYQQLCSPARSVRRSAAVCSPQSSLARISAARLQHTA